MPEAFDNRSIDSEVRTNQKCKNFQKKNTPTFEIVF